MWWAFGLLAAYILYTLFLRRRERAENRDESAHSRGLVVQTSISAREYDPNAYRFDDIARPEYRITYADEDGVVTTRDIYVHTWRQRAAVIYYDCWCYLRDERRTFRSDRILETVNLQTNRKIRDISQHRMR
ncbi:hypothetical protein B5M44_21865 [Shinella sumterensis]|nr:hypothetical protein B5M44_21865 [Shinella sumterensis]